MKPVLVVAPNEDREVVAEVISLNPEKPEYGSITVEQTSYSIGVDSFVNKSRKVAFIPGKVDDLVDFVRENNITVGCDFSEATGIEYTLVTQERAGEPFYEGQPAKINPTTNEELSDEDGQPIYRKTSIVTVDSGIKDVYVEHVRTPASTSKRQESVLSSQIEE